MKKIITKIVISVGILSPILAFAAAKDLKYLIDLVIQYFNYAIYLIIGLAIVMFVWNVYKYFVKGGDDVTAKKEAGLYVMWSIIGFFVILSLWGLVNILVNTFKLDDGPSSSFFGVFKSSKTGGGGLFDDPDGKFTTPNSDGKFITPTGDGYGTYTDSFGNPQRIKIDN